VNLHEAAVRAARRALMARARIAAWILGPAGDGALRGGKGGSGGGAGRFGRSSFGRHSGRARL